MADIIDLAEGVAAEIGDGAEVMFAPEFDLKGIKEKRIVVVPAGIETKPNARDYLEDRLKVQVGLLKKCTEDDIPALVREVVSTGRRFLHKWVAGVRGGSCTSGLRVCGASRRSAIRSIRRNTCAKGVSSPAWSN